jgi:hypothetical protein
MIPIRNRINFGGGWIVKHNKECGSGEWHKIEYNKDWERITISHEGNQFKHISYQPRGTTIPR